MVPLTNATVGGLGKATAQCLSPFLEMEGLFCANFSESRAGLGACRISWHTKCYECLGKGQFPIKIHQDVGGNVRFKQTKWEAETNQGIKGAHASMTFQCEWCWFLNLEG
jgi:hypothetical protein